MKSGSGKMTSKLTSKQERFVNEYLVDLNATQAAIRAGYSRNTAATIGCENLRKPNVKQAIAEATLARRQRVEANQDDVIAGLCAIATTSITDCVEWDNNGQVTLKAKSELSQDASSAIANLHVNANGSAGVKLYSKLRALELLGRHLGMFTDKRVVEHATNNALSVQDVEAEALRVLE